MDTRYMPLSARVYVAGHRGLVGSALVRALERQGYRQALTCTRAELDLTEQAQVRRFFAETRPEFVFLAAAKVGGIQANNSYPADFLYQNLIIQANVIEAAYQSGVKRLLFLGSSCIYPKLAPQPLKESYLLTGPLEPTNRPYAVAKIAGIEQCWAYNRQYGTRYLAVMPTNLYGPGDNYDLQNSHVLPALIRKFHEAKTQGRPVVEVWGTGMPRREFMYSDDMADACLYLMNLEEARFATLLHAQDKPPLINVGVGEDVSIRDLAHLVAEIVGFEGDLVFDPSKPDGTPRKLMDVKQLHALGWRAGTALRAGIRLAYQDFQARFACK